MSAKQLLARERERKKTKRRERAERRSRRILRLPELQEVVGLKHATIYQMMAELRFPLPIPLGRRAVGWLSDEIDRWLEERVRERDDGTAVRSLPLAGRKIEASPRKASVRDDERSTDRAQGRQADHLQRDQREARRVGQGRAARL
jgi:prophage regulatory protein